MRRNVNKAQLMPTRAGIHDEPCTITYGHNVGVRKMTMIFSVAVSQIILTPEEAEEMAKQILFRAACARGEKPS